MQPIKTLTISLLTLATSNTLAANFEGPAWPNDTVPFVYSTNAPLSATAKANFESAVDYYNQNTLITLTEVQPGQGGYPEVLTVSGITSGHPNATIGYPNYCNFFYCESARLRLRENSDVQTAIHEIFHVLGFKHEHQRADRDDHILVDIQAIQDAGDYSSNNYQKTAFGYILGSYDMRSVSHYRSGYFSLSDTTTDEFDIFDIMASPASYARAFRLNLPDSTPETIFDNPAIHIENHPAVKVEDVQAGWHSALWDFEYLGSGELFRIRSFWQTGKYLVNDAGNPAVIEGSSLDLSSPEAIWQVSVVNGSFVIKNTANDQYLTDSSGLLGFTSSTPNTSWIVQAVMPYGPYSNLSPMDQVALHQAYGEVFRIQLTDSTATDTDNKTLHLQNLNSDDSIDVEPLPFNPDNYWHSAMWHLVKKGKYFMIKNLWTAEFIHTEQGTIATDPAGTMNGSGADIANWHSAHWELELLENSFRIKNQWTGKYLYNNGGKLGVTDVPTDIDANWEINFVDWSSE